MGEIRLPNDFKQLLGELMNSNEKNDFLDSMQETPKTSIRLNPRKGQCLDTQLSYKTAQHCSDVHVLSERPSFIGDPGWHCGAYYVQEFNSTRVGETVRWLLPNFEIGSLVLDLCGAPGGKSTHISSVLRPGDLLIANEVIQSRNPILIENLSKWGEANFVVTRADASDFGKNKGLFSVVVADMPCSGEGMFRKDNKAIEEWSLPHVKLCASRQKRIADDIWTSLEVGGYFIYSTCTFNVQENEENVEHICKVLGGKTVTLPSHLVGNSVSLLSNTYRFYPHTTEGEGLFLAVIQKTPLTDPLTREHTFHAVKNKKRDSGKKAVELPDGVGLQWVGYSNHHGETSVVKNGAWLDKHPHLLETLPKISAAGIPIGLFNKNLWKPSAAIDLLCEGPTKIYPHLEISIEQAIQYYQREFLSIKTPMKGVVGLRWNGLSLGTGNAVNQGINNLWPNGWRIHQKSTGATTILARNSRM